MLQEAYKQGVKEQATKSWILCNVFEVNAGASEIANVSKIK